MRLIGVNKTYLIRTANLRMTLAVMGYDVIPNKVFGRSADR